MSKPIKYVKYVGNNQPYLKNRVYEVLDTYTGFNSKIYYRIKYKSWFFTIDSKYFIEEGLELNTIPENLKEEYKKLFV